MLLPYYLINRPKVRALCEEVRERLAVGGISLTGGVAGEARDVDAVLGGVQSAAA